MDVCLPCDHTPSSYAIYLWRQLFETLVCVLSGTTISHLSKTKIKLTEFILPEQQLIVPTLAASALRILSFASFSNALVLRSIAKLSSSCLLHYQIRYTWYGGMQLIMRTTFPISAFRASSWTLGTSKVFLQVRIHDMLTTSPLDSTTITTSNLRASSSATLLR